MGGWGVGVGSGSVSGVERGGQQVKETEMWLIFGHGTAGFWK